MQINRELAEFVVKQLDRKCSVCGATLNILSSRCVKILDNNQRCNTDHPWPKYSQQNYIEHFELFSRTATPEELAANEIKRKLYALYNCNRPGHNLFWCCHPKIDSELLDLDKTCVYCCKDVLDS